eukprot:1115630_1
MHGCPSGCSAYANSLCAAQGLCGYDFSTNRARCFCYWGHCGSACEQTTLAGCDMSSYHPSEAKASHTGDHVQTFTRSQTVTDPISGNIVNKIVNVTYDLTDAHNYETVYQINDAATDLYDYQLYFNIGGTVDSSLLPNACQNNVLEPCGTLNDISMCNDRATRNSSDPKGGWISPNTTGFAYRFRKETNECILLGTQIVKPWLLYDTDNPAHGVTLAYQNGSYAFPDEPHDSYDPWPYDYYDSYNPSEKRNCGITINLICPDTRLSYAKPTTGVILDTSEVINLRECQYEASFETAFACPYNCIVKDKEQNTFSVCNGHGLCVADPAIGFVRCVCDEKYYGDYCSHEIGTMDWVETNEPSEIPTSERPSISTIDTDDGHKINDDEEKDRTMLVLIATGSSFGVVSLMCVILYLIRKKKKLKEQYELLKHEQATNAQQTEGPFYTQIETEQNQS